MKLYILTSKEYGCYEEVDFEILGAYSTKIKAIEMERKLSRLHHTLEITEVELDEYCKEEHK